MKIVLKPYNEHYMNCYLNNLFSIGCSINENIRKLSYVNDYNITIISEGNFNYLLFDYGKDFYRTIYRNVVGKTSGDDFNMYENPLGNKMYLNSSFVEEIIQVLNDGNIVFLLVDLFYCNNGNIFYRKEHRNHFLLIVDWIPDQNCFISIDEGKKGYGYYQITHEEIKLLVTDTLSAFCLNVSSKKITRSTQFNLENIAFNSNRICNQIDEIKESFGELSIPKNYSELCHLIIFIHRCYNRQLSNSYLVNEIIHVDSPKTHNPFYMLEELKSGWYNTRAVILHDIMSGKNIDFEYCFNNILLSLEKEAEFWKVVKRMI